MSLFGVLLFLSPTHRLIYKTVVRIIEQMFGKKSTKRVMELFFHQPSNEYHLREIARETGLSVSTVSTAVEELEEHGLIEVEKDVTKNVKATRDQVFRDAKRVYNFERLFETGLVDRLENEFRPDAVVLFGSYAKGEDTGESDIDIAVINGKETNIEVTDIEELLGRKISIQHVDLEKAGENFQTTLANGIVLRGYLEL